MNKKKLNQPLMRRLSRGGFDNSYAVTNPKSHCILLGIKLLLDIFEPISDDYRHGLWIEIPRGEPSDWVSFEEVKDRGEAKTEEEYLSYWQCEFPQDTYWYYLSVSQYRGKTFLHISDNDMHWCIIHDDIDRNSHSHDPLDWFLDPLLTFLKEKVAEIAKNPEIYNRYVEENLPKRQRTGHIPRKDLDRIVPWQRRLPKDVEKAIRVLKECIVNEEIYRKAESGEAIDSYPSFYRGPLPDMSIRLYAKYFRVAYLAYEKHFRQFYDKKESKKKEKWLKDVAGMTDVEFYRQYQLGRHGEITDETNLDSAAAFKEMAFDHYGELGLSRMDVHATDWYTPGKWLITFGISYSSCVDVGAEIAVALYESGCPLIIYDAQKILDVLEERDNVLLTPHTFHDYFGHHVEGTVFDLPYECYLGRDCELTREQYDEIVSLAKWDQETPLVLDLPVPLDSPAYDLIREEDQQPLTVCGILAALQKKYDKLVFRIMDEDSKSFCYLIEHCEPEIKVENRSRLFDCPNEALLDAVIRYTEIKKSRQTL